MHPDLISGIPTWDNGLTCHPCVHRRRRELIKLRTTSDFKGLRLALRFSRKGSHVLRPGENTHDAVSGGGNFWEQLSFDSCGVNAPHPPALLRGGEGSLVPFFVDVFETAINFEATVHVFEGRNFKINNAI